MWDSTRSHYGGQVDFQRVDAESPGGQGMAQRYNVHGYPTLVWTDDSGRELNRTNGFKTTNDFIQAIDKVLQGQ